MRNNEWYIVCDTKNMVANDFIQLPKTWRSIQDIDQLKSDQLANLGEWSTEPDYNFLPLVDARSSGIHSDSIDFVYGVCFPDYLTWVRTLRDWLIGQTDNVLISDRMTTYDVVAKRNILTYRQALRDVTQRLIYAETWPAIPTELDFLRTLTVPDSLRPSQAFLARLREEATPLTKDQIIIDQCLRVKDQRDRRKEGGVKVDVDGKGYWFWTDEPSRNQYFVLDGYAKRNNIPDDAVLDNWKTMSGEFVPMTLTLLHQVVDAGVQNEKRVFAVAEAHRQALLVSDDPANYDILANWPEVFDKFAV